MAATRKFMVTDIKHIDDKLWLQIGKRYSCDIRHIIIDKKEGSMYSSFENHILFKGKVLNTNDLNVSYTLCYDGLQIIFKTSDLKNTIFTQYFEYAAYFDELCTEYLPLKTENHKSSSWDWCYNIPNLFWDKKKINHVFDKFSNKRACVPAYILTQ